MPSYLESGARVSGKVVIGRVRLGGFARAISNHRGPDDRGENGACRTAPEERRWRFSAIRGGGGAAILMEADVEGLIGAGRHERSVERLNYRNGYRDRSLDTRLGS